MDNLTLDYKTEVKISFQSQEHAEIARAAVSVDEEIQPTKAFKNISVQGKILVATLCATEARVLRVMLYSFYDCLAVIIRTLNEFS
jgi:tRNA threonylcarbamoyladenosine modification (KEOPS) complex  Pcc1 subunit